MELRVFGKYKLTKKLGSGAFGYIYHGRLGQIIPEAPIWPLRKKSLSNWSPRRHASRSCNTKPSSTRFSKARVSAFFVDPRAGEIGIPKILKYGQEGDYNVLVM